MAQCQLQCVWLNRKYHRIGPLFQGRFKAVLHEPSEALMINRYIHLNPVRLKALGGHEARDVGDPQITVELARQRVDALEQYPWSSYAFFAGTRSAPAWICTEAILQRGIGVSQQILTELAPFAVKSRGNIRNATARCLN